VSPNFPVGGQGTDTGLFSDDLFPGILLKLPADTRRGASDHFTDR